MYNHIISHIFIIHLAPPNQRLYANQRLFLLFFNCDFDSLKKKKHVHKKDIFPTNMSTSLIKSRGDLSPLLWIASACCHPKGIHTADSRVPDGTRRLGAAIPHGSLRHFNRGNTWCHKGMLHPFARLRISKHFYRPSHSFAKKQLHAEKPSSIDWKYPCLQCGCIVSFWGGFPWPPNTSSQSSCLQPTVHHPEAHHLKKHAHLGSKYWRFLKYSQYTWYTNPSN